MKKNLCKLFSMIAISLSIIISCGQDTTLATIAPFTSAVWDSTLDEISELEGTEYESTVSVYGGYNYIFPKQYLDYDGSIQYMFDDKEKLVGVGWFYIGNNQEDAKTISEALREDTSSRFGEGGNLMDSDMYNGYKWELKDRSILLVRFSQNDEYAVQISYISNEVNEK